MYANDVSMPVITFQTLTLFLFHVPNVAKLLEDAGKRFRKL